MAERGHERQDVPGLGVPAVDHDHHRAPFAERSADLGDRLAGVRGERGHELSVQGAGRLCTELEAHIVESLRVP